MPSAETGAIVGGVTVGSQSEIYHDLMRFKPEDLSPNGWAVRAGVSRTVWADMRRHGNPSRRTLERLLAAAGSSLAEFEALRLGSEPHRAAGSQTGLADAGPGWRQAPLPPLPLIATASAGQWRASGSEVELTELRRGEVIGQLPRPRSLAADPDAFALTIVDNSMWPRFRAGRHVAVSPRSTVAIGDDVLVRLRRGVPADGREEVLIKHLVERSRAALKLRQFHPDATFQVDAADVGAIFRIPGELI